MLRILLINAAALWLYMTVWFQIARRRQRIDTVDIAWGPGFALTGWLVVIQSLHARNALLALLVSVWGLRLAAHIYRRSKTKANDPRYEELTKKWKGDVWKRAYVSIFLTQAVLIWLVGLPLALAANTSLSGTMWLSVAGAAVWLVGFTVEAVSDRQLATFLGRKDHPRVMDKGLWRYSRHPNYFGELVQWWGIGIIGLQVNFGWIGLVGPAVLSFLIIFVSGLPPIERRRKDDPEYQAYRHCTSALLPLPPRPR